MELNILFLLIFGIALIGLVALPKFLERVPLSVSIIYVLLGVGVFSLPIDLPSLNPVVDISQREWMEYITEIIVIIALFGAGVRLDRRPNWKNWRSGLLLIIVTMPLCIAAIAFLGWWALALSPAAAILLGAVLAPTDPVLASTIQVGPPGTGDKEEVKFSLTLEAGLNDGLAFPFVYLALTLAGATSLWTALTNWVLVDFLYGVGVAIVAGAVLGRILVRLFFYFADLHDMAEFKGGLYVIAAVFLSYSLTEILGGYGFLAAFVAGVVGRNFNYESKHHVRTVLYLEELEQLILVLLLLTLGGLLVGGIFEHLTWRGACIGVALVFIIRPLSGMLGFIGVPIPTKEKLAISFFGIRGIGSLYYLAYADNAENGNFAHMQEIWAIVIFTILLSIVIHGTSVKPVLQRLYPEDKEKANNVLKKDD